jgi:uncharacterized protein with HEPN domain
MSEKDRANLFAILDSCAKIEKFVSELWDADTFFADEKTFDAVLMNFVIIGEAVGRLSEKIKDTENQIPWTKIKDFRNLVAHDYFGVDAEEVWQIIQKNLPALVLDIQLLLDRS